MTRPTLLCTTRTTTYSLVDEHRSSSPAKIFSQGPSEPEKRTIKLWVIFVHRVIFIHGGKPLLETLKKAGILRAIALERKQSKYGLLKGEGEPYL